MPADTALKRYSAMHLACPWRGLTVVPTAGIPQGERQAVMYLYAGILAAPPVGPPPGVPGRGVPKDLRRRRLLHVRAWG